MSNDEQHIAEMIKSGEYFEQSRKWYEAVFIGPISERSFFLIIALLAGLVAVFSFFAVTGLLPVTERPPLVLRTARMDDTAAEAIRLRARDVPMNQALLQFYLSSYVQAREGYSFGDYERDFAFVRAHSDAPTAAGYAGMFSKDNPRSPVNLLGERGLRTVRVQSIDIDSSADPMTAVVQFSTELSGAVAPSKTQWTATIQFYYSELAVITAENPQTGEETTTTQEPVFQVVHYALAQAQ